MLTDEEKRTLVAEGYPVPNKLPLTKSEEKALKRVRRKIKNKVPCDYFFFLFVETYSTFIVLLITVELLTPMIFYPWIRTELKVYL